jgi:DNA-binding CsgD family transcriptional regulator
METKQHSNSAYFIKKLSQSGLPVEAIANGTRLSIATINNILSDEIDELDEKQFNQLLGFYCCCLCKDRDNRQQANRLQQFKNIFQKQAKSNPSNYLLNYLKIKPWLNNESCVINHYSGKKSYLTKREQEVLYYLLQGYTQVETAGQLNISKRTIEYHWGRIRIRLNAVATSQILESWQVDQDG